MSIAISYPPFSVGSPVPGGNPESVLYIDDNGNLANDVNFLFDGFDIVATNGLFDVVQVGSVCIDGLSRTIFGVSGGDRDFFDSNGNIAADLNSRYLYSTGGNATLHWNELLLTDLNGVTRMDWGNNVLYDQNGVVAMQFTSPNRSLQDSTAAVVVRFNTGFNVDANLVTNASIVTAAFQTSSPSTGSTLTCTANSPGLLITPAGTIATLTIKLPSSPINGQQYFVGSTQQITTITWQDSGGVAANVIGGQATLGGTNRGQKFAYYGSISKWISIG